MSRRSSFSPPEGATEEAGPAEESSARPNQGPTAWTLTVPSGPAGSFVERAQKAMVTVTSPSEEGSGQVAAAIAAAGAVVSVIQPDPEKNVSATLAGYANPGHVSGQSGTVDQVSIKVRQDV